MELGAPVLRIGAQRSLHSTCATLLQGDAAAPPGFHLPWM
jgi:hypothetical protein